MSTLVSATPMNTISNDAKDGAEEIPFQTLMRAGRLFHAISLVARDRECVLLIAQELHRAALRTPAQQEEAGPGAVRPVAIGEEAEGYRQSRGEHWRVIFDALGDYRLTNMVDEDGDNYPLVDRLSRDEPGTSIADGDMEMVFISDEISLALKAYAALHPAPAPIADETSAEKLGKFGWHPDPVIDFEVEIEKLESRFDCAKNGTSKPGEKAETISAVLHDIRRAMTFKAGGTVEGVVAKNRLRELERQALAQAPDGKAEEVEVMRAALKDAREPTT